MPIGAQASGTKPIGNGTITQAMRIAGLPTIASFSGNATSDGQALATLTADSAKAFGVWGFEGGKSGSGTGNIILTLTYTDDTTEAIDLTDDSDDFRYVANAAGYLKQNMTTADAAVSGTAFTNTATKKVKNIAATAGFTSTTLTLACLLWGIQEAA